METQYETPEMSVYHFATDKEIMDERDPGSDTDPFNFNVDALLDGTYFDQ